MVSSLPILHQNNLSTFFNQMFQKHAQRVLIKTIKNDQLFFTTYAEFNQEAQAWANVLIQYKIQPGDRIGILARTSPNWLKAFVAATYTRATVVCLDAGLDDPQLIRLIEQSELKLLLLASKDIVAFTKVAYAGVTTLDIDKRLQEIHQTHSHLRNLYDTDPTVACMLYTSGTTGLFKGVLLEHSALLASVKGNITVTEVGSSDQLLCILPAHHVYGLVCAMLSPLQVGASILFPEYLDGPHILQALTLSKPTVILGVPRIYQFFGSKIDSEIVKKSAFVRSLIQKLLRCNYHLRQKFHINLGRYLFF